MRNAIHGDAHDRQTAGCHGVFALQDLRYCQRRWTLPSLVRVDGRQRDRIHWQIRGGGLCDPPMGEEHVQALLKLQKGS